MGNWHGKNKSNKQIRKAILYQRDSPTFKEAISLSSLITFYCRICSFETKEEKDFKNHECLYK